MRQKISTIITIGAGLGGLPLYHTLIKNKDKKEFNIKIFKRESDEQGTIGGCYYRIALKSRDSNRNTFTNSVEYTRNLRCLGTD
ncbi:unnamed protein product [Rhizophagus irregularis]|uniref:Uncharacterized protein n=1 Tax=Rhizophagus irregularis TaxID=588596 RepID=A0A915Z9H5_9GLOM|nr:unnamed protein product [Rhizophagus irregularis]CAB5366479.1 unnamed protein product [Rhizophagus irregularis]